MEESQAWDLYFASLVAFTIHPGYNRPPTVKKLAKKADEMIVERRKRWQP